METEVDQVVPRICFFIEVAKVILRNEVRGLLSLLDSILDQKLFRIDDDLECAAERPHH